MSTENKSAISARDVVETFFRHRRILFLTLPFVLFCVAAYVLVSPRRYESQMKFLVQNTRSNIVLSATETTAAAVGELTEEQINSELEILHSNDVLDAVVDPLWNARPLSEHSPEEIRAHNKLVTRLEQRLDSKSILKSNLISVAYDGDSPRDAQETLQRLSDAFLVHERAVHRPSGTSKFFVQEVENYRRTWNDAAQKFVDFQEKYKIYSLADDETSVEKDIAALEAQIRQMDIGLNELDGRLLESQIQMERLPQREITVQKSVPNQMTAQELNTLLVTLQNKRTALLTQFKAGDRAIQEADKQIEQTRVALDAVSRTSAQEQTTDINPSWELMRSRDLQDRIARRAMGRQRAVAAGQLGARRAELSRIQSLSVQYNLLKSKADDLKANYQLFLQKRDQAEIEDKMDAQQLQNVTIAEHPTFSYIPVSPRPLRTLLLALVTGLFLSLGLIYTAEVSRTTVVTPRELEIEGAYQVLATIPLLAPNRLQEPARNYHIPVFNVVDLEHLLRTGKLPAPVPAEERYFDNPPGQLS